MWVPYMLGMVNLTYNMRAWVYLGELFTSWEGKIWPIKTHIICGQMNFEIPR